MLLYGSNVNDKDNELSIKKGYLPETKDQSELIRICIGVQNKNQDNSCPNDRSGRCWLTVFVN